MREALAAADHDFVLAEPASKQMGAAAKRAGGKRRAPSRKKRRGPPVKLMIGAALCVGAAAGILINALVLQKTRHPAPLFARAAAPAAPAREPTIAETAPAPRAAANAAGAASERAIERAAPEKLPLRRPAAAQPEEAAATEPKPSDPISQLLKSPAHDAARTPPYETARAPSPEPARETARAPSHEPTTAASAQKPSKSVLAAQRALVKLGFVLKPDGVLGATTRQAIERYQRDRGRPIHPDLTPALLHQLSAESGVPIR